MGCILSKFYIKPQQYRTRGEMPPVVSYRNSTSNHNKPPGAIGEPPVVSYRNSTSNHNWRYDYCLQGWVVSYRNSTSNHNIANTPIACFLLYLIEILHQTTTVRADGRRHDGLYLIEILHQTTTAGSAIRKSWSCILSKFYIKPQLLLVY